MNVCDKCGKELSEDALFCNRCGNKVADTANTAAPQQLDNTISEDIPVKKSRHKLVLLSVASVILVLCIVFACIYITNRKKTQPVSSDVEVTSEKNVTDTKKSNEKPKEKPSEMTDIEKLRYEYFYGDTGIYIANTAETLLRNEDIFLGAKILVNGTVSTILPTESNVYSLSVSEYESQNDKYINVKGKYSKSDKRYIENDNICVTGTYSGIENFETIGGGYTNGAVLENCTDGEMRIFDLDEIKAIAKSIFGSNIDAYTEEPSGDYEPEYIVTHNGLRWYFRKTGGYLFANPMVSFDNGEHYYMAFFTSDYSGFYAADYRQMDKLCVVKYYSIDGTEKWSTEIKAGNTSIYYDTFFTKNDTAYMLIDDNLHIIEKDGSEKISQNIFKNLVRSKQCKDLILLYGWSDDDLVAIDWSGNIIWRDNNTSDTDGKHTIWSIQIIDNDILIEYSNVSYTASSQSFYYRRLNVANGELLNSLEL